MEKPIELTNDMTQPERIAAQNVNNCKMTVELLDRIQSLEDKLKLLDEEHGTSGIWEYTKKPNGDVYCKGTINLKMYLGPIINKYTFSQNRDINLPTNLFIDIPKGVVDCDGSAMSGNLNRGSSTLNYVRITFYSTIQYTDENIPITIFLTGRWK